MLRLLSLCLAAVFLLACGTNEEPTVAEPTQEPSTIEPCEDRTIAEPPKENEPGTSKPGVEIPDGAPPCDLVIQDIYVGTGAEAKEGATVSVQYVGLSWSTGQEFDSSWGGPEPVTFPLSGVVKGWQEGIPGMKEGGRRRLIIPPELAYADMPPPGSTIAPGETLVFVIDLVDTE